MIYFHVMVALLTFPLIQNYFTNCN